MNLNIYKNILYKVILLISFFYSWSVFSEDPYIPPIILPAIDPIDCSSVEGLVDGPDGSTFPHCYRDCSEYDTEDVPMTQNCSLPPLPPICEGDDIVSDCGNWDEEGDQCVKEFTQLENPHQGTECTAIFLGSPAEMGCPPPLDMVAGEHPDWVLSNGMCRAEFNLDPSDLVQAAASIRENGCVPQGYSVTCEQSATVITRAKLPIWKCRRNPTCYVDCDKNGSYNNGDVSEGRNCPPKTCPSGQVNNGSDVCVPDCDKNGHFDSAVDRSPCICREGELYRKSEAGVFLGCYKDCDENGSFSAVDGDIETTTGTPPTRKSNSDIGVCPVPCEFEDEGAYFDADESETICVFDCLDDNGRVRTINEDEIDSQCHVQCPNGDYLAKNNVDSCKKSCPNGAPDALVSEECSPVDTTGSATRGSMKVRTSLVQSRYLVGRVDRPNYVCRHKDKGTNRTGDDLERSVVAYLAYYCPPLNECGDDYLNDSNINTCKCRNQSGKKVNDTVCDYAYAQPFRMDGANQTITPQTGEAVYKELGPLGMETSTVVIPK